MTIPGPPVPPSLPPPVPAPFSPVEAFAWGWRKFVQYLGPVMIGVAIYVVVTVVLTLLELAVGMVGEFGSEAIKSVTSESVLATAFSGLCLITGWVLNLVDFGLSFVLAAAAIRAALDVTDGRPYDFVHALKGLPYGKVIGTNLLVMVVTFGAIIASVVPGLALLLIPSLPSFVAIIVAAPCLVVVAILAAALLYFPVYVVIDDPTTRVTDALRVSARLVRENPADALLAGILAFLVMLVGFIACFVGLLAAYPICFFASAHVFRHFSGRVVAP